MPRRVREGWCAARRMAKASCDERQDSIIGKGGRSGVWRGWVRTSCPSHVLSEGMLVWADAPARFTVLYLCHSRATRVSALLLRQSPLPFFGRFSEVLFLTIKMMVGR